jgi:hypothetical protein
MFFIVELVYRTESNEIGLIHLAFEEVGAGKN